MPRLRRATPTLLAALTLLGCATAEPPPPASGPSPDAAPPPSGETSTPPPAVHWVRNSAEHHAAFLEIYADATERLGELVPAVSGEAWGVILDADETVLDNSMYQKRLAERGAGFSLETWQAWVREEQAGLKPGAAAFIRAVRELGGRVAIVTNRDEVVCDPTRRNLLALGLEVDVVLCQQPGERGKEGRFRSVREGTAAPDLPPLDVVMWLGDNIHDFPGLDQEIRHAGPEAFADFGVRFFLLPNPMYGSWERNPYH